MYTDRLTQMFFFCLVVSTPLRNISQLGVLFPIYGKIRHVPKHQPVVIIGMDDNRDDTSQNDITIGTMRIMEI